MRFILLLQFIWLYSGIPLRATVITGDVTDTDSRQPVPGVTIHNVHSGLTAWSDSTGNFSIHAESGELIEFTHAGYKIARFRVPHGHIPPYFKIILQKGPESLSELLAGSEYRDYRTDSITYRELYKKALEFPELTGLAAIRHPFSAMSKRNRQIWAFQKEYTLFEQQKYVDYTFNEQLVQQLTGLQGDSLRYYLRRFRPSYEQLRSMNEYTFYRYIKESVQFYRTGIRPGYRPSIRRSPN